MREDINVSLSPKSAAEINDIKFAAAKKLNISPENISDVKVLKKSIDARSRKVCIHLRIAVYTSGETHKTDYYKKEYPDVKNSTPILNCWCWTSGAICCIKTHRKRIKTSCYRKGERRYPKTQRPS